MKNKVAGRQLPVKNSVYNIYARFKLTEIRIREE